MNLYKISVCAVVWTSTPTTINKVRPRSQKGRARSQKGRRGRKKAVRMIRNGLFLAKTSRALDSSPLRSLHLNTLYHYMLCTLLLYSGLFTNTSTQDTTLNLNLSGAPQLSYTLHLSRLCKTKALCTSAITTCLYTPSSLKFTQHQVPQ